ncbi:MAG: hypothetical protein PF569_01430 [Candidatus Woesearchaeota archaeon]|jgi:uncharacterized small protein (DUF1192 family)|nr:hypothetical protein [Candidatus Woesearchaeota archaeon]
MEDTILGLKATIIEIRNDRCDDMNIDTLNKTILLLQEQQQEIERLKTENIEMTKCLHSVYTVDLPLIDNLADISRVHRFTLLRKDLERVLNIDDEGRNV